MSATRVMRFLRGAGPAIGAQVALGLMVPYSGTIRPLVLLLEPGSAVVQMHDRRRVRNHLSSVHAAAMLNLAEQTGGIATSISIPGDARMIITRVTLDFLKKARGTLVSTGRCEVPTTNERSELDVEVEKDRGR